MPIRLMVFPDRPDALLVHADEGTSVQLPPLTAPFDRGSVEYACRGAGLDVRVIESVPGRWTTAMRQAKQAKHGELRQRENLRVAVEAARLRGSDSVLLQNKAEALTRKTAVDTEIGQIRNTIRDAKANVWANGQFMPPTQYRQLEARLEILKQESQALQNRIGELRDAQKKINIEKHEAQDRRFKKLVREVLDPQEFQDLCDAAEYGDDE